MFNLIGPRVVRRVLGSGALPPFFLQGGGSVADRYGVDDTRVVVCLSNGAALTGDVPNNVVRVARMATPPKTAQRRRFVPA